MLDFSQKCMTNWFHGCKIAEHLPKVEWKCNEKRFRKKVYI